MPDQKSEAKTADAKATVKSTSTAKPDLIPAGQATNPAVHQLLAELETARTNGAEDDAQDIIGYLAELGYSAG